MRSIFTLREPFTREHVARLHKIKPGNWRIHGEAKKFVWAGAFHGGEVV